MIFPHPTGLQIYGVYDRGTAGQERVVLQAVDHIDMSQYLLLIGVGNPTAAHNANPIANMSFWFGNGSINKGEYVHVYTGQGTPESGLGVKTGVKIYSVFWGNTKTIFDSPNIVPILLQMSGLVVDKTSHVLPNGLPSLNFSG